MNTQAPSPASIAKAALFIINNRWNRPGAPNTPDTFLTLWETLPAGLQAQIDAWIHEMEALDWYDEPKSKWRKRLIVTDVWATRGPEFIRCTLKQTRERLAAGTTPSTAA